MNRSSSPFLLAWIAGSVVVFGVLLASLALTEEKAARWLPPCVSIRDSGRPCAFCGMTTGFIRVARGNIAAAREANRAALPLYILFAANTILAARFIASGSRGDGS